ncbi:HNH endonuclease [Sphingobium sp. PNB]|uniref:HNH endonuclease n=1 Tax=Sphingobium sp. PNB TaxID=863934 RepID=UPI001CA4444B|nr:HNH endonuclease signature motif containing protein [Sphingobium sp. PNB]MCB4861959.1 HNH endonuclease [Sphingobium sp. PNB]
MTDQRSKAAAEYRKWYWTREWKEKRKALLFAEPLCVFCLAQGLTTAATVADHVVPHRGDYELFWFGELQALCAPCHDNSKARKERGGYDCASDLDGYPLDPNHPVNRKK